MGWFGWVWTKRRGLLAFYASRKDATAPLRRYQSTQESGL